MDDLVTTEWLAAHLDEVQPVDCTMFLADHGRDANAEYEAGHIPGALRLDIRAFADPDHAAPHMLPPPALGCEMLEALGIRRDKPIIAYDDSPLRSAARGWFTFRHYGAPQVAILDGGLGKWRGEGRAIERGPARVRTGLWPDAGTTQRIVTKADLLGGKAPRVVDARSAARFCGEGEEPRPGMGKGHVPGAASLPMGQFYREDGTFKDADGLRAAFAAAGVDPHEPFTASCGSGVTACSSLFAAQLLGSGEGRLYDGSWSEWGGDPDTPKEEGPAR
ncbi:sulfurtransferase [Sphingomicrobium aestuariivivum]|uniref:sulfurtransferase n=1 Tax=Sphingomicrobium aestuariivivum TaxID=1582356 RepID=UPI001FD6A4B9|nr:sulfurtransferase [Sphingomicrobium aestuariivivum]MCJ8190726.1 sulfurtransferase [Sphingomicrobium aestuariivivum]